MLINHFVGVLHTSVWHHWNDTLKGCWNIHSNSPKPNQITVWLAIFWQLLNHFVGVIHTSVRYHWIRTLKGYWSKPSGTAWVDQMESVPVLSLGVVMLSLQLIGWERSISGWGGVGWDVRGWSDVRGQKIVSYPKKLTWSPQTSHFQLRKQLYKCKCLWVSLSVCPSVTHMFRSL